MHYIELFIGVLSNTVLAIMDKKASTLLEGDREVMRFVFLKTMLAGLIAFVICLTSGMKVSGRALLISIIAGASHAASVLLIMNALKNTFAVYVNLFMSAGILLPCIVGWCFLGEAFSAVKALFLILLLSSLYFVLGGSKGKGDLRYLLPMFITFAAMTLMQYLFPKICPDDSNYVFSFIMYASSAVFLTVFSHIKRGYKEDGISTGFGRRLVFLLLLTAFLNLVMNIVLTKLSGELPAEITFPAIHGLKLVFVTLLSPILWKEKLTKTQIAGCVFAIISVCVLGT